MYYVKVKEDGQFHFPYSLYDLRQEFPNTSFTGLSLVEFDQEFLKEHNIYPVVVNELPSYDQLNYKPGELYVKYEEEVDTYYGCYDLVELSEEEKGYRLQDAKIGVRANRNEMLKNSDWAMVSDAPTDKEAWAAYRQELRDVTKQEGFPTNVVWPTPPGN
jgi:hypothetical protein